jgi:hypothetical protein
MKDMVSKVHVLGSWKTTEEGWVFGKHAVNQMSAGLVYDMRYSPWVQRFGVVRTKALGMTWRISSESLCTQVYTFCIGWTTYSCFTTESSPVLMIIDEWK